MSAGGGVPEITSGYEPLDLPRSMTPEFRFGRLQEITRVSKRQGRWCVKGSSDHDFGMQQEDVMRCGLLVQQNGDFKIVKMRIQVKTILNWKRIIAKQQNIEALVIGIC